MSENKKPGIPKEIAQKVRASIPPTRPRHRAGGPGRTCATRLMVKAPRTNTRRKRWKLLPKIRRMLAGDFTFQAAKLPYKSITGRRFSKGRLKKQ